MTGHDVIGDIHGHADKLEGLLRLLGYQERIGAWRHPERTAVFVGDLIDRGPMQRESVAIPRAMVEAGTAHAVLGNHEFNAIAYRFARNEGVDYCRTRNRKHSDQHQAFIEQVGLDNDAALDAMVWFRTLPMWLDLGDLRVVHACWDQQSIDHLSPIAGPGNTLTDQIVIDGTSHGTATYDAVETLLKGPEIDLRGRVYLDKGGHPRYQARRRWWDPNASTLRTAALIPGGTLDEDGSPFAPLPDTPLTADELRDFGSDVPVIVGHYWETGRPARLAPKAACVDYSAGKHGPLVAYRWSEDETEFHGANFAGFGWPLHLFAEEHGRFHIVSPETIDEADSRQEKAEAREQLETFGDLRRAGEIEELGDRVSNYGFSLDEYVTAIEHAAGRPAKSSDVSQRLLTLTDVEFDGNDDMPSDSTEFRTQHEINNEVDVDQVARHHIATSMRSDIPADLWAEFGSTDTPMFVDDAIEFVSEENLQPLTDALRERGYFVVPVE